jgi:glycosyltransferase involved in cell wall biosynthesis
VFVKTSVVIPCFNAAPWIRETLGSVISQSCGDLEVIVVDDGSTDGTAQIVRREFSSVHLVTTPNQGQSAARNLGTSLASGEFIQYLDHDDRLVRGKIRWQRELLEKSGADVAYGDWRRLLPSGEGFIPGSTISNIIKEPELDLFDANLWWPLAGYLFRRTIVDKVRGWNETLPQDEDLRFVLECAIAGARFVYSPGVVAYYRMVPGSAGNSDWILNRRCRYRNAIEIEAAWRACGELRPAQKDVLVRCLARLARACADDDRETSRTVLDHLEQLSPGYAPPGPPRWRVASRLVGFRRVIEAARWVRKVKRVRF